MTLISSIPFLILFLMLYSKSMFISIEIPFMIMNNLNFKSSLIIDWFSCSFIFTVLFISGMIMLYSENYIPSQEHNQFSLILLMFITSMVILITSNNLIFILLGWDGLGLSSYILVIYYQNPSSSGSGTITILSNRIGDILILISISMLMTLSSWEFIMNEKMMTMVMIMLTIAACTKSAQLPFSAWLPAAMAAPTPISALVHSSTLVTAGVYLLIRLMDAIHPTSLLILMLISSLTALYASMSASWEQDMKKIIALSTLSQISMMMFAIAMGNTLLAFFHLIIHALFKSMMFLCAGILIHNSSYQDMRHMGSMMNACPLPSTILGLSTMALMGLPFLSGFFSKDSIIEFLINNKMYSMLSLLMIISVGMTATYSVRMIKLSMMNFMKSKPDLTISPNNFMEMTPTVMTPLVISGGSLFVWMINSEHIMIIPFNMKMLILLSLTAGVLLSVSMLFKTKKFYSITNSAINLWFTHQLSSFPFLSINPIKMIIQSTDKTWKELYGPTMSYKFLKFISIKISKITQSLMLVLMLVLITPLILLMFSY